MSNPQDPHFPQQSPAGSEYQAPGYQAAPGQAPSYATQAQGQTYQTQGQTYQARTVPARPALPTTMAATNAFAVVSVILAFVQPIAGIVFGHIALSQIKRNGDSGRGLALTGLILGYAYFAFIFLFVILYISVIALAIGSMGAAFSGFDSYSY